MALQKKVNGSLVPGIVGEFSDDAPKSARQFLTYGKDSTSLPQFGKFFAFDRVALDTGSSAKSDVAKQGVSTSTWTMGILVNPKEHYTIGFTTSRTLPKSGIAATIAMRGHIWVMANTNTRAGADVYTNANGDLGDSTLAGTGKVKVNGATWLRSVAKGTATEVLSEISIDNPAVVNQNGGESL